jgi:8-oxo-dGTP diphosphatase
MDTSKFTESYPHLAQVTDLGIPGMTAQFERRETPPPGQLISNVNCVPFVGSQYAIITLDDGSVEIPGGTLEVDEFYDIALRRELQEEVGARPKDGFEPLGAWFTHSSLPEPFRPHLPHPDAYRYIVYAEIEIVAEPSNVGEQIAQVEVVSVDEAARRFRAGNRPDLAELYQLADAVRKERG